MAAPIVKRVFLSWSHTNRALKDALVTSLMTELDILRGVRLHWWEDSHITIGEPWRRLILARLADCDYGLLLLSPDFFASDFICRHELPPFVGRNPVKGALPVSLKPVPLDGSRTLHGVDRHQIFTSGPDRRSFSQTRGPARDRFVQQLATAIRDRVLADA